MLKKLIVLTGAGMSAESGIKTFRESGGLWEEYNVEEVASIEAWYKNPDLVLRFYNERRHQLEAALPNAGHTGLAALEKDYDVHIITQNIDNLHERAGKHKSAPSSRITDKGTQQQQSGPGHGYRIS